MRYWPSFLVVACQETGVGRDRQPVYQFTSDLGKLDFGNGSIADPDPFDQLDAAQNRQVGGDGVSAQEPQEKSELGLAQTTVLVAFANRGFGVGAFNAGSDRLQGRQDCKTAGRSNDASLRSLGRQLFDERQRERRIGV